MVNKQSLDELISKTAELIIKSKHAVALTGAGMSTESGIADFRGPNGIWTKNPEAEKQAYQSYFKFQQDPKQYWIERMTGTSWIHELTKAKPNPGHFAMAELEKVSLLKCIITQNIDNLHQKAGNKSVLDYHGNISLLRCFSCDARYNPAEYALEQLLAEDRLPPYCKKCNGVLKSDVVHFHEAIPPDVSTESQAQVGKCDVMLICGTSAVVYPFATLPRIAKQYPSRQKTIIIEINAEPTPLTEEGISDFMIQGKTGTILPKIVEEVKKRTSV